MIRTFTPWRSAGVWAAALAFPIVVTHAYTIHATTLFLMYSLLAMGLSVVVSRAGLLDLGYVAFFAVGAYFYAILNTTIAVPFWLALPGGVSLASGLGLLLGYPTLRVRGDYLAVVTLAFGEIVRQVLENWVDLTGGPKGIYAVAAPSIGIHSATLPSQYYYVALAGIAAGAWLLARLGKSAIALVWQAVRDNESAAQCCGIDARMALLTAFAIGASFAGFAGVLFASVQRFVSPESFTLDESILVLSIVVLAGGTSLPRLLIAAALLFGVPEGLRGIREYRTLIFGVCLIGFTVADERWSKSGQRRPRASQPLSLSARVPFPVALRPTAECADGLECQDVRKNFGGTAALDGLAMKVSLASGMVAVIGPNGAGKTTLFDCISGLLTPDSGSIVVNPLGPVHSKPPQRRAGWRIGRTFQSVRLFHTMTVRQNVLVAALQPAAGRGVLATWAQPPEVNATTTGRLEAALDFLQLQNVQNEPVSNLPIGYQRRVEIARALALRPVLLILDEIASGLNETEKRDLGNLLTDIWREGRVPILLVEHDMGFVQRIAAHVIVMVDGRLLTSGKPTEVLSDPRVTSAYLGSGA